jgi:hypothetical protein
MSLLRASRNEAEPSVGGAGVPGIGLAVALALAALVVSGCSGGKSDRESETTTSVPTATAERAGNAKITLLEAAHTDGPWTRRLSLRLGRGGVPAQFYVCAVWTQREVAEPCGTEPGGTLRAGSTLRLEQHPVGPGLERADSPGWGLVGTSEEPVLRITLSDFVSANNKPATVTYRVTLRDPSGRVVATSNTITIAWHR